MIKLAYQFKFILQENIANTISNQQKQSTNSAVLSALLNLPKFVDGQEVTPDIFLLGMQTQCLAPIVSNTLVIVHYI